MYIYQAHKLGDSAMVRGFAPSCTYDALQKMSLVARWYQGHTHNMWKETLCIYTYIYIPICVYIYIYHIPPHKADHSFDFVLYGSLYTIYVSCEGPCMPTGPYAHCLSSVPPALPPDYLSTLSYAVYNSSGETFWYPSSIDPRSLAFQYAREPF